MYVPLFADIITAERWLMIMPKVVLSNFLIYCVINAFTPGPGNILALNTVTNYLRHFRVINIILALTLLECIWGMLR